MRLDYIFRTGRRKEGRGDGEGVGEAGAELRREREKFY
jgi:hypothetical protein